MSTVPSTVACRDDEQKRVLEFCKSCIEQEKAGGLYVCGCPGTGKSLSMEKVKQLLVNWAGEVRLLSSIVYVLYLYTYQNFKYLGYVLTYFQALKCGYHKVIVFILYQNYTLLLEMASSTKCLTLNCVYYQGGFQEPDVLELNCTSLTKTSDIFTKVLKFKANAIFINKAYVLIQFCLADSWQTPTSKES